MAHARSPVRAAETLLPLPLPLLCSYRPTAAAVSAAAFATAAAQPAATIVLPLPLCRDSDGPARKVPGTGVFSIEILRQAHVRWNKVKEVASSDVMQACRSKREHHCSRRQQAQT